MPEKIFWREMNPARLHALYNARFRAAEKPPVRETREQPGLSEYLRGG